MVVSISMLVSLCYILIALRPLLLKVLLQLSTHKAARVNRLLL
uniref:Uncharacterized protein n=1 Tax=Siphoviridae sp. ctZHD14 TaxID=2827891 RepID=A0A8S5SW38_9CAUD|nr:MAG TPA: hypothetical protein [Siphoviridae sp. ctZHD14]